MKTEKIELRKLTLEDLFELKKIGRKTYSDAFYLQNSTENMLSYLNFAFSDERLTSELNEEQSEFYFARRDNETVGYLKMNFGSAQTDLKEEEAMELERIYLLIEFQAKGIGKQLLTHVIGMARKRGLNYLWLGVWKKNVRAVEFYKREGFVIFDTHSFKMGDEVQSDFLMKLEL